MDKFEDWGVCTYVLEREVRGRWEQIYKTVNNGYIFTNTDTRPRRVINVDRNKMAILPPGRHFGKDLEWKNL